MADSPPGFPLSRAHALCSARMPKPRFHDLPQLVAENWRGG